MSKLQWKNLEDKKCKTEYVLFVRKLSPVLKLTASYGFHKAHELY